jgi:hypothetical protein
LAPEKRRQRAQHGDEPPEEDQRGAVPLEQVLPELDPALGEPDVGTVPPEQPISERASDPEAQIVAHHGAARSGRNDQHDMELMGGAGDDRGGDERRFARHWDAHALDPNHQRHDEIAVSSEQMRDLGVAEEGHGVYASARLDFARGV